MPIASTRTARRKRSASENLDWAAPSASSRMASIYHENPRSQFLPPGPACGGQSAGSFSSSGGFTPRRGSANWFDLVAGVVATPERGMATCHLRMGAGWPRGRDPAGHPSARSDQASPMVWTRVRRGQSSRVQGGRSLRIAVHGEGLPMGVLEGWANDLPVIMTRECNLTDGFLCGAAIEIRPEVEGIAEGLARLWRAPADELARMGLLGRDLVLQRYTWPRVASELLAVYAWLRGMPVGRTAFLSRRVAASLGRRDSSWGFRTTMDSASAHCRMLEAYVRKRSEGGSK